MYSGRGIKTGGGGQIIAGRTGSPPEIEVEIPLAVIPVTDKRMCAIRTTTFILDRASRVKLGAHRLFVILACAVVTVKTSHTSVITEIFDKSGQIQ